jgi:hypothetical protein
LGKVEHAQHLTSLERPQAVFSTGCLGVKTCISFDRHRQFSEVFDLDPVSLDRHVRSRKACPHEGGAGIHPKQTQPGFPINNVGKNRSLLSSSQVVGGHPSERKAAWIPAKSKRE